MEMCTPEILSMCLTQSGMREVSTVTGIRIFLFCCSTRPLHLEWAVAEVTLVTYESFMSSCYFYVVEMAALSDCVLARVKYLANHFFRIF